MCGQTLHAKIPITILTAIIRIHYSYIGWLEDFIGIYIEQLQKRDSDNYVSHPISTAEIIIPCQDAYRVQKPHRLRERVLASAGEVNTSAVHFHTVTQRTPQGRAQEMELNS